MDCVAHEIRLSGAFRDIVAVYWDIVVVVLNKATKKFKEVSSLSVVKSAKLVNRIS
jgi:hypothetical protein